MQRSSQKDRPLQVFCSSLKKETSSYHFTYEYDGREPEQASTERQEEGPGMWLSWQSACLEYAKLQFPSRHHTNLVHTFLLFLVESHGRRS